MGEPIERFTARCGSMVLRPARLRFLLMDAADLPVIRKRKSCWNTNEEKVVAWFDAALLQALAEGRLLGLDQRSAGKSTPRWISKVATRSHGRSNPSPDRPPRTGELAELPKTEYKLLC
jgi:hypothetical protein